MMFYNILYIFWIGICGFGLLASIEAATCECSIFWIGASGWSAPIATVASLVGAQAFDAPRANALSILARPAAASARLPCVPSAMDEEAGPFGFTFLACVLGCALFCIALRARGLVVCRYFWLTPLARDAVFASAANSRALGTTRVLPLVVDACLFRFGTRNLVGMISSRFGIWTWRVPGSMLMAAALASMAAQRCAS